LLNFRKSHDPFVSLLNECLTKILFDVNLWKIVWEQILQMAEVATKGSEVFESRENFLVWMNRYETGYHLSN
jgi:hypothetical protein